MNNTKTTALPGRRLHAAEVFVTTRLTAIEVANGACYRTPLVIADPSVALDHTPRPAVYHRLTPQFLAWVEKILPRIRSEEDHDRLYDAMKLVAVALRDRYVLKKFSQDVFLRACAGLGEWKPPKPVEPLELFPTLAGVTWDELVAVGGITLADWRQLPSPDVPGRAGVEEWRPLGRWWRDRGELVFDPLMPSGPEPEAPKVEIPEETQEEEAAA
jgi:hypothetical protein